MIKISSNYKKVLNKLNKETNIAEKRLKQVARKELKAGAKRFRKKAVKHIKKNTGIRLTQSNIIKKYTDIRLSNLKKISMEANVVFYKKGLSLVHFISGKIKATTGPLKSRKSPYVAVYKKQKSRLKRGFIIKRKNEAGTHVLLRRLPGNKTTRPITPSLIHMAQKTGFNIERQSSKESVKILIRILKRESFITAPLERKA